MASRLTPPAHVTYPPQGSAVHLDPGSIVQHAGKGDALEYAAAFGLRYVPWRSGQTLAEAIESYDTEVRERLQRKAAATPARSRRMQKLASPDEVQDTAAAQTTAGDEA